MRTFTVLSLTFSLSAISSAGRAEDLARPLDRLGRDQHERDHAGLVPRLIQLWMVPRCTSTSPALRWTMVPSISMSISPDSTMA